MVTVSLLASSGQDGKRSMRVSNAKTNILSSRARQEKYRQDFLGTFTALGNILTSESHSRTTRRKNRRNRRCLRRPCTSPQNPRHPCRFPKTRQPGTTHKQAHFTRKHLTSQRLGLAHSFLQTSSASCGGSFARSTCVMDFCLSMQCCTLSSKPVILLMCTCIASLSGQAPGLPLETSFITDCVPRDSHAKKALVRDVGSWVLLRCVGSQVGCAEVRGVSCWRVCSNRVRGVGSPRPLGVGSPRERGVGSRSATLDATKPHDRSRSKSRPQQTAPNKRSYQQTHA